jgi:hypothetical protein
MDHVAFACVDRAELATWASRLDELRVKHGGIVDAHYGSGVSFRRPGQHCAGVLRPTRLLTHRARGTALEHSSTRMISHCETHLRG